MASALQAAYEAKIRDGVIQADPAQAAALASLVRLEMEMCGEEPEGGKAWTSRARRLQGQLINRWAGDYS